MLEEENNKENNKKKIIIGSIVAIVFLLVLVIGATYAFFSINLSNGSTSTNINVNMGKLNNIAIKGTENNTLHIKVSSEDMKLASKGTSYYATTDTSKNYLKESEDHVINIANLLVEGEMTPTNICTAKLKVEMDGELKNFLQAGDTLLHIEGGRSKHDIDLSLLLEEYPIEFVVDKSESKPINTSLKLINRDADQTYIAGKTLSVTLTIEGLTCKVQNKDDAVEKILANSEEYLEKAEEVSLRGDVLRRFQGQVTKREDGTIENDINNYICFGTDNSETCKNDTDHYMYRIIGVALNNDTTTNTEYGQLKLIKKEALEERIQWWEENWYDDIEWPNSITYQNLIGSAYLQNINYMPFDWNTKIENHRWLYGDMINHGTNGFSQIGAEIFKIESGKKIGYFDVLNMESGQIYYTVDQNLPTPDAGKTIRYDSVITEYWKKFEESKVGLMYLSDYYISVSNDINCRINYDICSNGWLFLLNNDSKSLSTSQLDPPLPSEQTMTRVGFYYGWNNMNSAIIETYNGNSVKSYPNYSGFTNALSLRPVIYLTSGLELSGTGTIDDPFIITN